MKISKSKNTGNLLLKKLLIGVCFALVMILPSIVHGQSAELRLLPDSIAPGEHVKLILEVEAENSQHIVFPVLSDTITQDIEIISYGRIDTVITGTSRLLTITYVITSWEDGYFPVPPLSFKSVENADTISFESSPALLEVSPVEIELAEGLKDIRPIFKIPLTFAELLPYIIGLLILVVAVVLIIRFLKKRKKAGIKEDIWVKPDIPAHVAAISSLEKLRNQKLWQSGKVKKYHTELTFILRMYLEKRFRINATEMTSTEIKKAMVPHVNSKDVLSILQGILEQADLVKFAKHMPEASENEAAIEMAIEFVRYNIPSVKEDPKNTRQAPTLSENGQPSPGNEQLKKKL